MSNICPICNYTNDETADGCIECGTMFEITTESTGKLKITLISSVDGAIVEIPEEGALIGRGRDIAPVIFNHKWVSEYHCRITTGDNGCYIEDVGSEGTGSSNGTYVNAERLPPGAPTRLQNEDTLEIAHLRFCVKIECREEEPQLMWVVRCKKSGVEYEVVDETSRVLNCDCGSCGNDHMAKKSMSETKPKQIKKRTLMC
jgi:hypothetical protein